MVINPADIIKLLLAVVLGGSIGFEREIRRKGAGLRTITLICVGATLFTILSIRIATAGSVASTIVTGIGFLGAGVILHENNRIKGLTTAADIWISAAIGMAIGSGNYLLSLIATFIILVVMLGFAQFERRVDRRWEIREYQISLPFDSKKVEHLQGELRRCGLQLGISSRKKVNGMLLCTWNVIGSSKNHERFVDLALADPDIRQIEW